MYSIDFHPRFFSMLGNYNKDTIMTEVIAGIIVGIVALPLAIAFAIASNPTGMHDISPERGIITAIVAGLLISVFGGSKSRLEDQPAPLFPSSAASSANTASTGCA